MDKKYTVISSETDHSFLMGMNLGVCLGLAIKVKFFNGLSLFLPAKGSVEWHEIVGE